MKINKKDKTKTTKILKSGPNKGKERICTEAYDMADAYVIGKSFLLEV